MTWLMLSEPYIAYGQREVVGKFKASPMFRLKGGNLGQGATAFGLITIPPGERNVRIEVELDGSELDPHHAEWQVTQTRGIHLAVPNDDVKIENSSIRFMPREAIYAHGFRGLEIHHSVSEKTESFLNADYFTGSARRANSHLYVWGHCQHKNGRSYGIPGSDKSYVSVIDPRYFIGGNGINGFLCDSEIADFSCVGEYKGTVKLVAPQRVRVVRCHGANQMIQGSVYFSLNPDPALGIPPGPHEINGANGQLPYPIGPPGVIATDTTFESCLMDPQFTLWRVIDDPLWGGNTFQVSYPQWNTKIRDCDFWWQPSGQPGVPVGFASIQCYRTGHPVDVRGCRFHRVPAPDPANPNQVRPDGQPGGRSQGLTILEEGGRTGWASSVNPDWIAANTWDAP